MARPLIRRLQHSILGSRLTITQAGFTPACLQTISSSLPPDLVVRQGMPQRGCVNDGKGNGQSQLNGRERTASAHGGVEVAENID